jgi:hypothetical protein
MVMIRLPAPALECVCIVKTFHFTSDVVWVQHNFDRKLHRQEGPSGSEIKKLVQKFENVGSLTDRKALLVYSEQQDQ